MESSDDDTFGEESNINEESDLGEIDEIFEDEEDDLGIIFLKNTYKSVVKCFCSLSMRIKDTRDFFDLFFKTFEKPELKFWGVFGMLFNLFDCNALLL